MPGNAGGGKEPHFQRSMERSDSRRLMMSLRTPETVEKLQTVLREKAKASPSYRFYSLYDKVCRTDVLAHAYDRCRANGGAPGVDGQTFSDIESYGVEQWRGELAEELRKKTYRESGRATGVDPEGGRQTASAGNPDDPRPRGADGVRTRRGADLRRGPAA